MAELAGFMEAMDYLWTAYQIVGDWVTGILLDTISKGGNGVFWATFSLIPLLSLIAAKRIQKLTNLAVKHGAQGSSELELRCTPIGWTFLPVYFPVLIYLRYRRWQDGKKEKTTQKEPLTRYLVYSHGVHYLKAGVLSALLMFTLLVFEKALRFQMGISEGISPWLYWAFGHEAELAWYLELTAYPHVATSGALLLGGLVFWLIAHGFRFRSNEFYKNQFDQYGELARQIESRPELVQEMPEWALRSGQFNLIKLSDRYKPYFQGALGIATTLLGFAVSGLEGNPYRLDPFVFVGAFYTILGLALHVTLRGDFAYEEPKVPEPVEPPVPPHWDTIKEYLQDDFDISITPEFAQLSQTKTPVNLPTSDTPAFTGEFNKLVLQALGHEAFTAEQVGLGKTLERYWSEQEDPVSRDANRTPGWLLRVNEHTGGTVAAQMAAIGQVVRYGGRVLVVFAEPKEADRFTERFDQELRTSSLSWSCRALRLDVQVESDFMREFVPEVLVASLHDVVTRLLVEESVYDRFLNDVSLVIVHKIDQFFGASEAHGQLTFRRLLRRFDATRGKANRKGSSAVRFLAIGSPSMDALQDWASQLLGNRLNEIAPAGTMTEPGSLYLREVLRLGDIRQINQAPVTLSEILAACEKNQVPWSYRPAGDGRRHLGKNALPIVIQPRYYQENPVDASVVIVEGTWSKVKRELVRLERAGSAFAKTATGAELPIGIITISSPAEDIAFIERDSSAPSHLMLKRLPLPFLRAPVEGVVRSHLVAELLDNYVEVADLIDIFDPAVVPEIQRLADADLLIAKTNWDLHPRRLAHEERLHLHLKADAVDNVDDSSGIFLPGAIEDVTLASNAMVLIRDRSTSLVQQRLDAAFGAYELYPGRIYSHAHGRSIVAERLRAEVNNEGGIATPNNRYSEILVEPFVNEEVSVPKRVFQFDRNLAESARVFKRDVQFSLGQAFNLEFYEGADLSVIHQATLHLDSLSYEVRQYFNQGSGDSTSLYDTAILTMAPLNRSLNDDDPVLLPLGAARLICAALRLVLPNLYRGFAEHLDVGLDLSPDRAQGAPLSEAEGFVFFDTQEGGNGATRTLARDGLQMAMQLARHTIERVLKPNRLMAIQDQVFIQDTPELKDVDRRSALEWLDAILASDGDLRTLRELSKADHQQEEGEGQEQDLGRVWFTEDTAVSDLRWTRLRWPGSFVDVSIDAADLVRSRSRDEQFGETYKLILESLSEPGLPSIQNVVQSENLEWLFEKKTEEKPSEPIIDASEDEKGPGLWTRLWRAVKRFMGWGQEESVPEEDSTEEERPVQAESSIFGVCPSDVADEFTRAQRTREWLEVFASRLESQDEIVEMIRGLHTSPVPDYERSLLDVISTRGGSPFEKALLMAVLVGLKTRIQTGLIFRGSRPTDSSDNVYVALYDSTMSLTGVDEGDSSGAQEAVQEAIDELAKSKTQAKPSLYHLDVSIEAFEKRSLDLYLVQDPLRPFPYGNSKDQGPVGWNFVPLPAGLWDEIDELSGEEPETVTPEDQDNNPATNEHQVLDEKSNDPHTSSKGSTEFQEEITSEPLNELASENSKPSTELDIVIPEIILPSQPPIITQTDQGEDVEVYVTDLADSQEVIIPKITLPSDGTATTVEPEPEPEPESESESDKKPED
jgi:hypothetical protein